MNRQPDNLSFISAYHRYVTGKEEKELPPNVCTDLEVDDFFTYADCTSSAVGRQYLYHLLHRGEVSEVQQHEAFLQRLHQEPALRSELMKALSYINTTDDYNIASLLQSTPPTSGKLQKAWLYIGRFLPLLSVCLMLMLHSRLFLLLTVVSILLNFSVHYLGKKHIYSYYFSAPRMLKMLRQARRINERIASTPIEEGISQTLHVLHPLEKRLNFLRINIKLDNDISVLLYSVTELLNVFFLQEAYATDKIMSALCGQQKQLESVFRFVGRVDVLCSVSLLRESLPYHCLPTATLPGKRLSAIGLFHPLIERAVPNDLHIDCKSVLIVGSNMSGKTCFIRTVALNLLAAKVLNTCFARTFSMNLQTQIHTAIHNTDSLQQGKSFFLQEAERIKEMLDSVSTASNSLFLLDEPFKGTNTPERIAICKAVLHALAERGGIVLISTHDTILGTLLQEWYQLYHFSESVRNGKLYFDYLLKTGAAFQSNALRILELCQYPEEVIEEARANFIQTASGTPLPPSAPE